jgi:molybdenum cofactor biosynthesis enzyme MoaA
MSIPTVRRSPFAVLASCIDALVRLGALTLDLLAGEPLLHPDIVEIVRRIKSGRRGSNRVTLVTNAFKLTRSWSTA